MSLRTRPKRTKQDKEKHEPESASKKKIIEGIVADSNSRVVTIYFGQVEEPKSPIKVPELGQPVPVKIELPSKPFRSEELILPFQTETGIDCLPPAVVSCGKMTSGSNESDPQSQSPKVAAAEFPKTTVQELTLDLPVLESNSNSQEDVEYLVISAEEDPETSDPGSSNSFQPSPSKRLKLDKQATSPSCNNVFENESVLAIHLRSHTGARSYPCALCPKTFSQLGNLQVHSRIHEGRRPFDCPEPGCGKSFTQKGNLKTHLRVHSGERPYLCMFCTQTFRQVSNLNSHLRTHARERAFRIQGSDLVQHTETDGWFTCNDCKGKSFRNWNSFQLHRLSLHEGLKPYGCGYCAEGFCQMRELAAHLSAEHARSELILS